MYSLDGSPFQPSATFTNLAGGNYTIFAEDGRGCLDTFDITLSNLNGPSITNVSVVNTTCQNDNGSIEIVASSTNSITYSLDGLVFQPASVFSNLPSGVYTFFVQDENGCQASDEVEVASVPQAIIDSVTVTSAACDENEGSITIYANLAGVTYSLDGINFQPENLFENVLPGTFEIIIEDTFGCRDTSSAIIQSGVAVTISNSLVIPTTCGLINGVISISASGGTGEILYFINSGPANSTGLFSDLAAGDYIFMIRDESGCSDSIHLSVGDSDGLLVNTIEITPSDCGLENGSITVDATGSGQVSATITGVGMAVNNVFSNLAAGQYQIHFLDQSICQLDTTILIPRLGCGIYIPNTFSPNGDGINDLFTISTASDVPITITKFLIFDRWGNNVYEAYDFPISTLDKWWDGTFRKISMNPGVFSYFIEIRDDDQLESFKGNVTLVR